MRRRQQRPNGSGGGEARAGPVGQTTGTEIGGATGSAGNEVGSETTATMTESAGLRSASGGMRLARARGRKSGRVRAAIALGRSAARTDTQDAVALKMTTSTEDTAAIGSAVALQIAVRTRATADPRGRDGNAAENARIAAGILVAHHPHLDARHLATLRPRAVPRSREQALPHHQFPVQTKTSLLRSLAARRRMRTTPSHAKTSFVHN